jgi:virginiamycin A acetyltransferase
MLKSFIFHIVNTIRLTKTDPRYFKYEIGEWTYGKPRILSWGEHCTRWVTTYLFNFIFEEARHITEHPLSKGDVIIGNDVWIGHEVLILSGITVGDGSVIGARSVVTKDVPPYSIVAGNPASIIRLRFDEEIVEKLLKIKWWNYPVR